MATLPPTWFAQTISNSDVRRRRDELLTEMYILSRGRDEEGYRILTGELDPGDLRAYLEAHDLRKQYVMRFIPLNLTTHSFADLV